MKRFLAVIPLLFLLVGPVLAQPPVMPQQGAITLNTTQTSAANATQTITLTGVTNVRITVRAIVCFLSAAGTATLTVSDGAATPLNLGAIGGINTAPYIPNLGSAGFTGGIGNAIALNVGAGGVGVTSTCSVVADRP